MHDTIAGQGLRSYCELSLPGTDRAIAGLCMYTYMKVQKVHLLLPIPTPRGNHPWLPELLRLGETTHYLLRLGGTTHYLPELLRLGETTHWLCMSCSG